MRILQIAHSFMPYNFAGTEVYAYNLAKELSQNNEVYILHRINNPSRKEYELRESYFDGLKVFTINNTLRDYSFKLAYNNPSIDAKIIEVINKVSPDVIHIQHLLFLSSSFLEEVKKRNIPVVFTLNDYWYLCPRGQLLKEDLAICNNPDYDDCVDCLGYLLSANKVISRCHRFLKNNISPSVSRCLKKIYFAYSSNKLFLKNKLEMAKVRNLFFKNILSYADKVIVPSEFVMSKYIEFGLSRDKTVLIRYGVLSQDNQNIKSVSKNLRFGYIGSLQPSKGVDVLIEAFNQIKISSNLELTIYGELVKSGFYSDYCQLLRKKAVSKSIHFAGKFMRENLSKIFNEIDVLIVPSIWNENCPNVILEALSFKIPVIASRIGGMTELIEDGKTGLLFNAGDSKDLYSKIKIFVDNPELIKSFSLDINPPVDIKEHTKLIKKIYTDIIKERPIIEYSPPDYNFENLYRMNFTQQYNKEANLFVAGMLEKVIKQLLFFKKELNLKSIMLSGSFAFEEGSVIFNKNEQKLISDFDLVLAVESGIGKELKRYLLDKIHSRFKKNNINPYQASLCFSTVEDICRAGNWGLYNLTQAKKILWGEDILSSGIKYPSGISHEKFESTSARQYFETFSAGLSEILYSHPLNEKQYFLYFFRPILKCCGVLLTLADKFTCSYRKMNEVFKDVFPSRFPELFKELPYLVDFVDRAVKQKLDPSKNFFTESIEILWPQAAKAYLKIFELYLNSHYRTHGIEFVEIFKKFVNDKSGSGWYVLHYGLSIKELSIKWSDHFKKLPIHDGKLLNHIKILKLEDFVSPQYIFYNARFYLFLYLYNKDSYYLELSKKYLSQITYLRKKEAVSNVLAKTFDCSKAIRYW